MLASTALDIAAPLTLFYGLHALGLGLYPTLVVSAAVPALLAVTRLVRNRRVDGVTAFVLLVMGLSALASVISHSPRALLMRESWITAVSGVWFLASAPTRNPLAFQYTRPFLEHRFGPMGRSWDDVFATNARFRRVWRLGTVLWGLGACADAVVRILLVYALPLADVPAASAGLMIGTSLVLIVVTNVCYLRAGLFDRRSALFSEDRDVEPVADPGRLTGTCRTPCRRHAGSSDGDVAVHREPPSLR